MRFIDKFSDITGQVALTEDWVDEHWIQDEGRYANLSYHIRRPAVFIRHLHFQQESLCCYCMKSLLEDGSDSTIEHIIPQGGEAERRPQDREAFNQYNSLDVLAPLVARINYKWDFDKNTRIERGNTSLPHDVHLLNMVLSCDSMAHCNHARGDQFIEPAYLYPEVHDNLGFLMEGILVSDAYYESIEVVRLNHRELVAVRGLWAYSVRAPYFHEDWTEETIQETAHLLFAETLKPIWNELATEPVFRGCVLQCIGSYRIFEEIYREAL